MCIGMCLLVDRHHRTHQLHERDQPTLALVPVGPRHSSLADISELGDELLGVVVEARAGDLCSQAWDCLSPKSRVDVDGVDGATCELRLVLSWLKLWVAVGS